MEKDALTYKSQKSAQAIITAITRRLIGRTGPLVVSLDGGSGAGKSTLATVVATQLGATVIQCDDFFAATITDDEWESYSLEQKCCHCIDWNRMQAKALLPLIAGKNAQYYPFSFSSECGFSMCLVSKEPSNVIILDGIYSSLPKLADVVDFKILVDVLPDVRYHRHNLREGNDDVAWHKRWDPVEDYYFTVICPPTSFDLIVINQ